MSVKSVYNFVSAPKALEVYNPSWSGQVSYDIPFSDGESGEIEIKITSKSPIFIRNGHSKKDAEIYRKTIEEVDFIPNELEQKSIERYLSFSNYNGKYFIPASSLKGMFRNVMEIISQSKLTQINNHRHAIRQIMRTEGVVVDEGYELSKDDVKRTIRCGYLIKRGQKYYIHSCGRPLKIRYTDIDKKYKSDFGELFGKDDKAKIKEHFDNRTAAYKYENVLKGKDLEAKFETHPLDGDKQSSWVSQFQPLGYVRFANDYSDSNDVFEGRIVLVGQASNYDIPTSRRGEYVFKGKKDEILANAKNRIELSEEKFENFKFINRDGKGASEELKDWTYWKNKIEEGIPVFYRETISSGKKEVLDFGLSFSYKQPARFSVKELLPKYSEAKDLTETIFGSAEKDKQLKGRVYFGNAFCLDENPNKLDLVTATLGSPKSSYFPYYLKQNGTNSKLTKYNTYNTRAELRGYKRYPIKNGVYSHPGESKNLQSQFIPLDENTEFTAKIRFFNLRPIEIGALLNAITLNNTKETFHTIGYAKPLGYGKIKVDNVKLKGLQHNLDYYLNKFQVEMIARFGDTWINRVNELLSMSLTPDANELLEYNDLKEFQELKNQGYFLDDYTTYGKNYNYFPELNTEVATRKQELVQEELERVEQIGELESKYEEFRNAGEFKEAYQVLENLLSIGALSIEEQTKRMQSLEELSKQNEAMGLIDDMIERADLEELKEFVKENPYHSKTIEINKLIRELSPSEYPERFTKVKLNQLFKEIPQWIRRDNIQVTDFENELYSDFKRVLEQELTKKSFKKRWSEFETRNTWDKISAIIGESLSKKLYEELID